MNTHASLSDLIDTWEDGGFNNCSFVLPLKAISRGDLAAAVGAAWAGAQARQPFDPTTSTDPQPTPQGWVIEVNDGIMTREELTTWLSELSGALAERGFEDPLEPYRPARIPNTNSWKKKHPSTPTAFCYLEHSRAQRGLIQEAVMSADKLPGIARVITEWVRDDPRPAVIVRILNGPAFLDQPHHIEKQLIDTLTEESDQLVKLVVEKPKALRRAGFRSGATVDLQVFDESVPAADSYEKMLGGVRSLAPFLEYAFVRLAHLGSPSPDDTPFSLNRPPTALEDAATNFEERHLWRDHTAGAFIAQLLTSAHFDRLGITPGEPVVGYATEDLGNDRYLLRAADFEPWLRVPTPSPGDRIFDTAHDVLGALEPNLGQ